MMTTKTEEIILHAGLHKTATTSIQRTLYAPLNNKILMRNGYLYSRKWPENHSIPLYSAFCDHPEKYHINVKRKLNNNKIKVINRRYLETLGTEVSRSKQTRLVLSGEDVSQLTVGNLETLRQYLMSLYTRPVVIHVIVYVRNPVDFWTSMIQERIKNGDYCKSIMQIKMGNMIRNRVENLISVFGKNRVSIYGFERAVEHDYGPVGHFLSTIGFENHEIQEFSIKRANTSMSLIAADMLSFTNERVPLIQDGKLNQRRTDGDTIPFTNITGPKFDIPYDLKRCLFENSQDEIDWLKLNYGIDYSNFKELQGSQPGLVFSEKTIRDIEKLYTSDQLSPTLRRLIIDYIQNRSTDTKDENSKFLLKSLLRSLSF